MTVVIDNNSDDEKADEWRGAEEQLSRQAHFTDLELESKSRQRPLTRREKVLSELLRATRYYIDEWAKTATISSLEVCNIYLKDIYPSDYSSRRSISVSTDAIQWAAENIRKVVDKFSGWTSDDYVVFGLAEAIHHILMENYDDAEREIVGCLDYLRDQTQRLEHILPDNVKETLTHFGYEITQHNTVERVR